MIKDALIEEISLRLLQILFFILIFFIFFLLYIAGHKIYNDANNTDKKIELISKDWICENYIRSGKFSHCTLWRLK